ncbi:hypothetical protein [Flavobacterium sp. UBA4854]|uniref:hypothetical protein n=1 Tax=Flavobacterium sp. UBA4854 TaxID=1946548 RepID=UPI00258062CB|nr:hypothetical protein [Flavobacterium sp. UBA4854]
MSAVQIQKQKELENAVRELQSFMDITAVTLHEAQTAGRNGHILTIILREESDQIASEMYVWADKVLNKYTSDAYIIINIADLLHRLKSGNLYYLKWYLSSNALFKDEEFDFKIKTNIPLVSALLKKAIKKCNQYSAKAESLRRGSQHYEGTNNHPLALYTIHQTINLLFGYIGEMVMGKEHSDYYILRQLKIIKDFAPVLTKIFDAENKSDLEIAKLMDEARINFPYSGDVKIKKDKVKGAQKKLSQILKEAKKIFQEQLSYCERKAVIFSEPKQLEKQSETEICDLEKIISTAVTSYLKTEAIYCFDKVHTSGMHYYLLIFTSENKTNAVHDLADIIRSRTKEKCSATLLIHTLSDFHNATADQKHFFTYIILNGTLLFKKDSVVLEVKSLALRSLSPAKEYLSYRNIIVNNMESWQEDYEWACYAPLKALMLHTMIEQICLGMLRFITGYSPNHFSLSYLLELCRYFNEEISTFFPRITEQDRNLFTLLSRSHASLRYSGEDTFSEEDMNLLQDRYNDFARFCTSLVKNELERIENLTSVES